MVAVSIQETPLRDRAIREAQPRIPNHCGRGHEYTPKNTYIKPDGTRECRACKTDRQRQERAERRMRERAALKQVMAGIRESVAAKRANESALLDAARSEL